MRSAFENQGEICLCGSRLFVEAPLYDRFVAAFADAVGRLRIGDPLDEATEQGALVSAGHRDKVESYIELARELGRRDRRPAAAARPACPAASATATSSSRPSSPACRVDCRVNPEEIFGPVVTITPFTDGVGRRSPGRTARATAWRRRSGRTTCGAPTGSPERWTRARSGSTRWLLRDLRVPFGGMKDSGVGREGGDEALRFFTEPKTVVVALT